MNKEVTEAFKRYVEKFKLHKAFPKLVERELHVPYEKYLEYTEGIYAVRRVVDLYDKSQYARFAESWEDYVILNRYSGRVNEYIHKHGIQKTLAAIKLLQKNGQWNVPKGFRDNRGLLFYLKTHPDLYHQVKKEFLPDSGAEKMQDSFDILSQSVVKYSPCVSCQATEEKTAQTAVCSSPGEYKEPRKAADSTEDYSFYDFSSQANASPDRYIRLPKVSARRYEMLICRRIYDETLAKGLCMLRIRVDNLTNDVHLVFNKDNGVEVKHDKSGKTCVRNKDMALFIRHKMEMQDDDTLIELSENVANSSKFATYKLLKH